MFTEELDWVRNVLSMSGACLILLAYVMLQLKFWTASQLKYSWTNLVGASFLLGSAAIDRNFGFIILESAWVLVSLFPIVKAAILPKV